MEDDAAFAALIRRMEEQASFWDQAYAKATDDFSRRLYAELSAYAHMMLVVARQLELRSKTTPTDV